MVFNEYKLLMNKSNLLPKLHLVRSETYYVEEKCDSTAKTAAVLEAMFQCSRLPEEHIYLIAWNMGYKCLGVFELSHGTTTESVITPKEVLTRLLLSGAIMYTLAHNHPSGLLAPSDTDISFTEELAEATASCGIYMADHMILAGHQCNSLSALGYVPDYGFFAEGDNEDEDK